MVLLDSTLPPLTPKQQALIEERLASYNGDPDSWLSQEEFDQQLRKRLSRGA